MVCKVNNGEMAKELFKPFEPVFKESCVEKDSVVHDDSKSSLTAKEEMELIEELVGMTDKIIKDIGSVIIDDKHTNLLNK